MKIHYFQRYHAKENVETSNAMLMLSRLYNHNSDAFFTLLNSHILNEVESPEINFDLQVSGTKSVPDAVISQKSFKIVVETKLYNQFGINQLVGHLDQFKDEEIKILLTLDPKPINTALREELETILSEKNKTHLSAPIKHVNLTFKQLLEAIESVIDERDTVITEIFDDFRNYCFEENLIPDEEQWMRAVAVWETIQDNLALRLYYDPASQGYSGHGYIGLYSNKSIRAVGKLQKTIVVSYEDDAPSFTLESGDVVTEDERRRICEAIERAEQLEYDLKKEPQRFFLVESFCETNYPKTSKYPIRKSKRFNLADILCVDELPSTEQIAEKLARLTWE